MGQRISNIKVKTGWFTDLRSKSINYIQPIHSKPILLCKGHQRSCSRSKCSRSSQASKSLVPAMLMPRAVPKPKQKRVHKAILINFSRSLNRLFVDNFHLFNTLICITVSISFLRIIGPAMMPDKRPKTWVTTDVWSPEHTENPEKYSQVKMRTMMIDDKLDWTCHDNYKEEPEDLKESSPEGQWLPFWG